MRPTHRPHQQLVMILAIVAALLVASATGLFLLRTSTTPVAGTPGAAPGQVATDDAAPIVGLAFPAGRPGPPTDVSAPDPVAPADGISVYAKTKAELEKDGYNCTYSPVSGGIHTCTKKGEKDYTCSSATSCEQLRVTRARAAQVDLSGSTKAQVGG